MPLFESLTASLVAGTTVALLNRFLINNPKAPCNKQRDDTDDGGSSTSTAVSVDACGGGALNIPPSEVDEFNVNVHFYRSRNSKGQTHTDASSA